MREIAITPRLQLGKLQLPGPIDQLAARLTNRLIRATPRQVVQVPTREPIVSFTFDDVPDSAFRTGAAILEAYGARGTFYISGSLAGRADQGRTMIDAAGCTELAARGHELGCHTYGHRDLRHVGRRSLAADLARNQRYLDAVDPGQSRRNFAYPYNSGAFGRRKMLAERFRTCRAGGETINRGATDPAFLSAVEIRQPEGHVCRLTRWIDELVADPGWLIFFTHDVSPTPTPYGCRPVSFGRLVEYADKLGCHVLTVDAALDRMKLRERTR